MTLPPEPPGIWRGWLRLDGVSEWKATDARGTWDEAWRALLALEAKARTVERLCCPEGKNPNQRKRPR